MSRSYEIYRTPFFVYGEPISEPYHFSKSLSTELLVGVSFRFKNVEGVH